MLTPADVTVIIPTRNSLELLKRTLATLERQDVGASAFQTVVVNDASTDDTGKWLDDYHGTLRLKSVNLTTNAGRAAARNIAADNASGALLVMIDGDMELPPGLMAGHLRPHNRAAEKLVLLGNVRYDRSLGRRGYAHYIETRGAAKLRPGAPLPGRYFISSHASLRRDLFREVGGFDQQFKVHGGEDLDLGMKLVKAGAVIRQAPELASLHLHIRPLADVLRSTREYGRLNVPLLLAKHPQLLRELKLDIRGWRRSLLTPPVYQVVKAAAGLLNGWRAPALFYDYLLLANYYQGWRESTRLKN